MYELASKFRIVYAAIDFPYNSIFLCVEVKR